MKNAARSFLIVVLLLVVTGSIAVYALLRKPVNIEASGSFQDGSAYRVSAKLTPKSPLPFGKREFQLANLELTKADTTRAVPSLALNDVEGLDPNHPIKVFEEGPVIVVSIQSEKKQSIQWRFLNGQFVQRRILKGGEVDVKNVETVPQAPTLVENIPPDAPRRLQPSSLLPPTGESTPNSP